MLSMLFGAALAGLAPGTPAPDVSAPNQDGVPVRISSLRGKPVLLYFYPKDDTPGCTKQACKLRDEYRDYQALGAVVLGVSRQDAQSHKAFRAKYRLPFDLLTDADGSFAKAFAVKSIPVVGLLKRQSVLVGPDGKVVKFFEDVNPETHSAEVLAALRQVQPAAPGTHP